LLKLSYNYG